MTKSALLMLLFAEIPVTAINLYFFWKVLKTPPKTDSFCEKDPPLS